ncbi:MULTISPECIES: hypothetical protein [Limnospira]|uniref:hypothetical protein n=2 Tax=Sirenicapillariaceae TaxID=2934961 RepID=UPI0009FEC4B3|nr:hypothetical protein [Limnospira maxima]MBD2670345.1 hypothetical protein [Arthrospira platensis FACHB-439]
MGFTRATKGDRFFRHISPCWVSPKPQRAIAFSVISLLSLLGFTRATKGDRFFRHISPCWVSPEPQRAIAFSVISLPVG